MTSDHSLSYFILHLMRFSISYARTSFYNRLQYLQVKTRLDKLTNMKGVNRAGRTACLLVTSPPTMTASSRFRHTLRHDSLRRSELEMK